MVIDDEDAAHHGPILNGRASGVSPGYPQYVRDRPRACPDGNGRTAGDCRGERWKYAIHAYAAIEAGVAMNASVVHRWAFAVAAGSVLVLAWHAAIDAAVIVPVLPSPPPSATPDAALAAQFAWLRDIAPHDLGVRALAAATFLALAGFGRSVIDLQIAPAGSDVAGTRMATTGRLLIVAGLFGALGQLVELGGHQAAIIASESLAPATSIGLIQFFVDQVGAAFATCAWAIFGAAAFAGALATRSRFALPGVVLGAALVVMVAARLFDDPADIAGTMLRLVGLALVPVWAVSLLFAMKTECPLPHRLRPA